MPKYLLSLLMAIALLVTACGNTSTSSSTTDNEDSVLPTRLPPDANVLVLGDVSGEADQAITFWQPLARYLANNLQAYGYDGAVVEIAPDLETMANWLEAGIVDIYIDSSYPSLIVRSESNSVPILRHGRGGVLEYNSVIFALDTSGLTDLSDLEGQLVAFDAPFSTSGFFLPSYYLTDQGYLLAEKPSNNSSVNADEIGYVFSYEDTNALQWLLSGRVIATVTNSIAFSEIPEATRERIVILGETETLPSQLVSVRADLDPEIVEALTEILKAMDETEEGREVLRQIETSEFDDIPGGLDNFVSRINEMFQVLEG